MGFQGMTIDEANSENEWTEEPFDAEEAKLSANSMALKDAAEDDGPFRARVPGES
jgi:hypothetical protein